VSEAVISETKKDTSLTYLPVGLIVLTTEGLRLGSAVDAAIGLKDGLTVDLTVGKDDGFAVG
jgi:hypothetical protein